MEHLCLEIFRKLCCSSSFIAAFQIDALLVVPLAKELAVRFLKDHHKRWQNIRVHPCQWNVIWELGEQIL